MKETSEEFIQKVKKRREEKAEGLALLMLDKMLKQNLPIYDIHYISNRTIKILEQAIKKVSFDSPEIKKLRNKLLEQMVKEVKKELANVDFESDPAPETQERNDRCESAAREWVTLLLDKDLLLSDKDFFEQAVVDDDMFLFYKTTRGFLDEMHNLMITALGEHERKASKKLWGVDKEGITFEMLDTVLKRK